MFINFKGQYCSLNIDNEKGREDGYCQTYYAGLSTFMIKVFVISPIFCLLAHDPVTLGDSHVLSISILLFFPLLSQSPSLILVIYQTLTFFSCTCRGSRLFACQKFCDVISIVQFTADLLQIFFSTSRRNSRHCVHEILLVLVWNLYFLHQ